MADNASSSVIQGSSKLEEVIDDQSTIVLEKYESLNKNLEMPVVEQEEMVAETVGYLDSKNTTELEEKMDPQSQSESVLDKPDSIDKILVQNTADKKEMAINVVGSSVNQDASESKEVIHDQSTDILDEQNFVQITVDEDMMKRRISTYIYRKRKDVDRRNVEEFCGRHYIEEDDPEYGQVDSCARIDAIHFPRGGKSRAKVSKVENKWGPQTRPMFDIKKIKKEPVTELMEQDNSLETAEERLKNISKMASKWGTQTRPMIDPKKIKKEPGTEDTEQAACLEIIEERLQSMESHLKIKTDSSLRRSIFQRLKNLEDQIMFLEGISPEYIHFSGPKDSSPKKKTDSEKEKLYSNWSVDDIQKRIKTLQKSLKTKSVQSKKDKKD